MKIHQNNLTAVSGFLKFRLVLVIAALPLILFGCGGSGSSSGSTAGASTTTSSSSSSSSTSSTTSTTTSTTSTTTTSLPAGTYAVQLVVTDFQKSTSAVSGIPGTVSCADASGSGATCNSTAITAGTVVTLTANAATGYGVSWGGACASAGTSNTCVLTMNSSKSATISFDPKSSGIWWVSTTGSDSNDGRSISTAFSTFHKALTSMSGGDTLYIDDGTYAQSIGGFGGNYSPWDTSPCGSSTTTTPPCLVTTNGARNEGPNGLSSSQRTRILGYRRHMVTVNPSTLSTGKRIGLQIFKGQHIEVGNIVFMHTPDGAVDIEQDNDVYIHQVGSGFADPINAGDNNKAQFYVGDSTGVVVEECWAWGYGARYGVVFHGGTNNIARRNVVRYDGALDGNPKAGISLYSENNSLAENNIVIDFDSGTDSTSDVHAALFTTSSVPLSSPSLVGGLGSVAWYGNVAVNITGQTNAHFFFDSLTSIGGTITAINNVIGGAGGATVAGLWLSNDNITQHNIILSHNTLYNSNGRGVRVDAPQPWSAVTYNDNLIDIASGQCFQDVSGSGARTTSTHNQMFGCTTLAVPNDTSLVTGNPALSYLLRIDAGAGKGTASDGGDRGATVVKRYSGGTSTGADLWPFPNEDIIKTDMCNGPDNGTTIKTRGHNQTGWCASGKSLTKYVWEQLGNTSPY
jgi:hypothetical protein